jgi:hypothetical protein
MAYGAEHLASLARRYIGAAALCISTLPSALGSPDVRLPAAAPLQILAEVDRDGNGMIDYEEFCFMMKGKTPQGQKGTHNRNHIMRTS